MGDLRELMAELGHREVRTLLNSGNVVFSAGKTRPEAIARRVEAGLLERLSVSARVLVLTAEAFRAVVAANRLTEAATNPARLLAAFCDDAHRFATLRPLARQDWAPEALALGPMAAYLWCPEGILAGRLVEAVGRRLGDCVTTRNWATVLRISAALDG
jgi:uncharacterized protein (DUF1697 family)